MKNHEIKYLSISQEDLIDSGAFDLPMAMDALQEGMFRFRDGDILFPDKIVQIFDQDG